MGLAKVVISVLLALPMGLAHPHGVEEKVALNAAQPLERRSLDHCNKVLQEPAFVRRNIERRTNEVLRLKKERGLEDAPTVHGRQFNMPPMDSMYPAFKKAMSVDHKSNKAVNKNTKAADLFADSGSCMTTPEVTEGPLYVQGEQIRRELTDGQGGVKITVDIQVVDIKTCEPLKNVAVDFWSCNATGVYGGVLNYPANGDPADKAVINSTALRGVQFTDDDGVAVFDTVVPGHYVGRANHMHAIVHTDVTKQPNGTITGGRITHVGQMYFDQALLAKIEATHPYITNRQGWTQNSADYLVMMGAQGDDPFLRYVMLGDSVSDGLFAWIRFGVDASSARSVVPAAFRDAQGGHQNMAGPVGDGKGIPLASVDGFVPLPGLDWNPEPGAPNAPAKLASYTAPAATATKAA